MTNKCNQVATLVGGRWDKCFEKKFAAFTEKVYVLLSTLAGVGHREIKVMVMEKQETKPRIRKLTPLECWRLMGFDDEDFRKAEAVNSNTQLYKQAGNSIVVNVLEGILGNLLRPQTPQQKMAQDILSWLDEVMEEKYEI